MTVETSCTNTETQWYVLRVTYQRELSAKKKLDEMGIESFVPMKTANVTSKTGKSAIKKVSALHNYIFVHSNSKIIDDIKQTKLPWLRYAMIHTSNGKRIKMTVPQKQMYDFMTIANSEEKDIAYLSPDETSYSSGDKVRILRGPFAGVEGAYIKMDKRRGRSVVVRIDGVTAIATATIPARDIEPIKKQDK